jgi:hypothetical protein
MVRFYSSVDDDVVLIRQTIRDDVLHELPHQSPPQH